MNFLNRNTTLLKKVIEAKDVSFLFLLLTIFFLSLSINISSYCILLSFLSKLMQVWLRKEYFFATNLLKTSWTIGLLFLIYVLINSTVQSGFIATVKVFGEEYSHFVLLFFVPILIPNKVYKILLAYALLLSIVATIFYVGFIASIKGIPFTKNVFDAIVHLHHTYLAMYILLTVHLLLFSLYAQKRIVFNSKTIFIILFLILSFLTIFLLGSKFSMIVLLLFIGAYITVFLKNHKTILVLSYTLFIVSFIVFNQKISTSYRAALDFRLEIWQEAINSISENPLFGDLTMSEKEVLNKKHYLAGKYYLMDSDLNSHNQYLSLILRFGFVGFMFFVLLALQLFKANSFKLKNRNFINILGFFIIFLSVFYIENIFDRHHGIVFFTVFFNYYLVTTENEKI